MFIGACDKEMYAGQLIGYVLRPICNIPITWITEITHMEKPHYFIDEQRFGPYAFWHHEHRFHPIEGGVEMIDLVHYKLPYSFLGGLIHKVKLKRDLETIFSYRRQVLEDLFGTYNPPN